MDVRVKKVGRVEKLENEKWVQQSDGLKRRLLIRTDNFMLAAYKLVPGTKGKWHSHEKEEQVICVQSGTLLMRWRDQTEEKSVEVKAGEAVYIPPNVAHKPEVTGTGECITFDIHAPPPTSNYQISNPTSIAV